MIESHTDNKGYNRKGYSTLVHRQIAYHEIYKKNKDRYSLPFSKYQVHHKDKNKQNNDVNNLELVERESHEKIHKRDIRERVLRNALIFLGILFIGTFGTILIFSFGINGINFWGIGLVIIAIWFVVLVYKKLK